MAKNNFGWIWIVLLIVVVGGIYYFRTPIAKFTASLGIGTGRQATVLIGTNRTLENVNSLPINITVTNTGTVTLTNVRVDASGTTPSQLASAFAGKTTTLPPGGSGVLSVNLDITSMGSPAGTPYTFQAMITADYTSNGVLHTFSGFTLSIPVSVSTASPGMSVTIGVQ